MLINASNLFQANKTFVVNLFNAANATIADGQATGTIVEHAPASITINSGNNQSMAVGQDFGQPLQVVVKDADGNPLQGASVTFTAPPTGASTAATVITVKSDANGVATSGTLTAGTVSGKSQRK